MPEKPLPFVITDRRKFNAEGEARPDADPSPEREPRVTSATLPEAPPAASSTLTPQSPGAPSQTVSSSEVGSNTLEPDSAAPTDIDPDLPPAPTPEQMEQSRVAFLATADRIDTAIRAANPGADHPPAMSFEQLVQSVYMQAILQLGGGTQEGQQPQVDILGARQSIDMLGILADKTTANLSPAEEALLSSAIFELRLAFLEITQALARSAQQRAAAATGAPPPPGSRPGPNLVR